MRRLSRRLTTIKPSFSPLNFRPVTSLLLPPLRLSGLASTCRNCHARRFLAFPDIAQLVVHPLPFIRFFFSSSRPLRSPVLADRKFLGSLQGDRTNAPLRPTARNFFFFYVDAGELSPLQIFFQYSKRAAPRIQSQAFLCVFPFSPPLVGVATAHFLSCFDGSFVPPFCSFSSLLVYSEAYFLEIVAGG